MTDKEREELKKKLWKTADDLRQGAGLKASQYAQPVFGLIFLRFAENKYRKVEPQILAEYKAKKGKLNETPIEKIAMKKCGFYLPDKSRYEFILKQPSGAGLAKVIHDAMEEVEKYNEDLVGVLPKNVYFEIAKSKDDLLLEKLVKNFQDIPDNVEIDIFGEIYEYFLGEFSLKEGQGGGEFYTPVSVVRYMVKVLKPTGGKIFDPACGSGGMFVQAARYMHAHNDINLSVSGVEKDSETVKLAKMNLALNNVKGVIKNANTFYEDPFVCFGKFDYVMASYNAGAAESEQAFKELMELLKQMKEEEQRAAREEMTDQQLEIYDILCQGKKLTQAQEQTAKLAAKGLVEALQAHQSEVFTEEWFKYQPAKESVYGFIQDTLAGPLDGFFDKPLFVSGSQGIYNLFLDRAINGEDVVHAA